MGAPNDDEPREVWPPREVEPKPLLPELEEGRLELRIDESDPLPTEPEFTPSRLTKHAIGKVAAGRDDEPKSQIVVFDPKNPSGRTRRDMIFDANDDDYRRMIREDTRRAFVAGAFAFACVLVFFRHFVLLSWVLGLLAGGFGGLIGRATGDNVFTWAAAMAALGIGVIATKGVLIGCLVTAILAAAGWITGLVREST